MIPIPRTHANGYVDLSHIVQAVRECLQTASYAPVRDVACDYNDGVLVLHGQVPTFFQKQLAQEAVLHLEGIAKVVNEVEVVGSQTDGDEDEEA